MMTLERGLVPRRGCAVVAGECTFVAGLVSQSRTVISQRRTVQPGMCRVGLSTAGKACSMADAGPGPQ